MKSKVTGNGFGPVKLMACSFIGMFFISSAIGCQQESVTSPDHVSTDIDNSEVIHATVYVDGARGSDDYDGSSRTYKGDGVGPKKTIQAGVDITPRNSICYVAPGNYCEQITMAEGVWLFGAGAQRTFIDGGNKRGNVVTIWDCNTAQTIVCGFTIRGGSCYGDNAGIRIQYSSNVVIRNNVLTANRADGIRVYFSSLKILNNTITGNGRNGIMAHHDSDLEVVNNIVTDNKYGWPPSCDFGWGLYSSNSAIINSSYNDIWENNNNYGIETEGFCQPGTGDISTDPVFVAPGEDFHLSAGSPCIDAGIDVGLPYHGKAPDMGAFEYKRRHIDRSHRRRWGDFTSERRVSLY